MYDNLSAYGVGGFASQAYWSSSESDATHVWYSYFEDGSQATYHKDTTYYVRAMRSFTADASAYALRDTGPSGGLIFYRSGSSGTVTFYEAAPVDQSTSHKWSNITNVAVTGTGTALGTGLSNTNKIVAQASHTDSAAQACLYYSLSH